MIGLDTNVLVRYLTKDDETQWQQASQLIESGEQFFIAKEIKFSSFSSALRCNVNNRFNLDIRRFAKCLLREFHRQKYKFPLRVFDR